MQILQTKKGKDNAIYNIYSGSKEELMFFNSASYMTLKYSKADNSTK